MVDPMIYSTEVVTDFDSQSFARSLSACINKWQSQGLSVQVQFSISGELSRVVYSALLLVFKGEE